jgi:hypothetical protein
MKTSERWLEMSARARDHLGFQVIGIWFGVEP